MNENIKKLWHRIKRIPVIGIPYNRLIGNRKVQYIYKDQTKEIKENHESTSDIVVMIHDGNRPMLPQDVITDNLVKQKKYGSAVTVIPTTEVVFVSKDGIESNEALNRDELWRTQTPHSYAFDELWKVHNQAIKDGVTNMAASCSLMQKYGYMTYFSKGSEKNIKITTVEDIEIFKALLNAKNDEWIKK